jgi:hypothetical protein
MFTERRYLTRCYFIPYFERITGVTKDTLIALSLKQLRYWDFGLGLRSLEGSK